MPTLLSSFNIYSHPIQVNSVIYLHTIETFIAVRNNSCKKLHDLFLASILIKSTPLFWVHL